MRSEQSIREYFALALPPWLLRHISIQGTFSGVNILVEVFSVEEGAFTYLDRNEFASVYHPVKRRGRDSEIAARLLDCE